MYAAFPPSDYYGASVPSQVLGRRRTLPSTGLDARSDRRPGSVIAVGTALAGGPPHRSQRALLTHWAPALGNGAKAHFGKGMHHTGGWQPPSREAVHPCPADPSALAATFKRLMPELGHL